MKKLLIISLLILGFSASAQYSNIEDANKQEAFVQLSRSFYFSGESVWFNVFLFDAQNQRLVTGRRFLELVLIDRAGKSVWEGRLKVLDGRGAGQFNLSPALKTDTYALHVGFIGEEEDQFLNLKTIEVLNRADVIVSEEPSNQINTTNTAEGISIDMINPSIDTKSEVEFDLKLIGATQGNVSIQVRKVMSESVSFFDTKAYNQRSSRPIALNKIYDHHYLQFDLKRTSEPLDSILPMVFVPEQHKTLGFLKSNGDSFTLDATDLSAGAKSFYFNQFIYRAYIPPDLEWDYEKERYKDNLIPYYEGEMAFERVRPEKDFSAILSLVDWKKPVISAERAALAKQMQVRELMTASAAYDMPEMSSILAYDSLMMEPLTWRRTEDYEAMDNMAEFLFEIVNGIKAWYTDKRKDIRVLNVDGAYDDIPLMLVNGVPTRDIEKVLDLPMDQVEGVGVIKDHKSRGQYKYNQEAQLYGPFGASGIIVIKLKPDVINPFQNDFNAMLKIDTYLDNAVFPEPLVTSDPNTPDFRTELVWRPNVNLERKTTSHSFIASDIAGTYEIIVQGFKKGGGKIFARRTFSVVRQSQ